MYKIIYTDNVLHISNEDILKSFVSTNILVKILKNKKLGEKLEDHMHMET